MTKLILTPDLAFAAATDKGNASMRRAGRKVWNRDDYNACIREYNRLLDFITISREATNNMCEAGSAHNGPVPPVTTSQADYVWRAMIAAAKDKTNDP